MPENYYTFPLNAEAIIKNGSIDKCAISESIAANLQLLITSRFGECHYDYSFGCAIWNVDFNNMGNDNQLVLIIKDSLYTSLKLHEKRLSKLEVTVEIEQKEIRSKINKNLIKKRVNVVVDGTIKKTNEHFKFKEHFFIGPLSY